MKPGLATLALVLAVLVPALAAPAIWSVPAATAQEQPQDADGDGAFTPEDCNDADASVHPGAEDRPGNGTDENCDGADAEYTRLSTPFPSRWSAGPRRTRLLRFKVSGAPAGSKLFVHCKGKRCPFRRKKIRRRGDSFNVGKVVKRPLVAGSRLEVRLLHPDHIGKVVRYQIRPGALPEPEGLCMLPGAKRPTRCT